MSDSGLSTLQRRLLAEISQRSNAFFMTGGGVLVEWVLRHRRTDDLDMFTTNPEAMASCDAILRASAEAISAQVEAITTTPDFRRYLMRAVLADLGHSLFPWRPRRAPDRARARRAAHGRGVPDAARGYGAPHDHPGSLRRAEASTSAFTAGHRART
jgi:hypothetical protein